MLKIKFFGAIFIIALISGVNYSLNLDRNFWLGSFLIVNLSFLFILFKRESAFKKINQLFMQIGKSNKVILGTSDQILNTNRELEEGALEQSESLHETASALDEINAMAERSSTNCDNSIKLSAECVSASDRGMEAVSNLRGSFEKIKEGNISFSNYIGETNNKILEISNVIKEINSKTKIINDIVFQTKLLSFNASVEAARAGEHGKGFSVVAEEIGNLANLSGKAAEEISSMLEESTVRVDQIVEESLSTVEVISTASHESVQLGENAVSLCGESLNDIAIKIDEVNRSVYEISSATNEQRQGVSEITKAVNLLNQVNQKTNLVVGQSKQVAYTVSKESELLHSIVEEASFYVTGNHVEEKDEAQIFEWSEEYLIHVNEMDDEHQVLVGKINILVDSLNNEEPAQSFPKYKDMCNYTVEHFTHEEELMRSFNYEDYDAHKKIHDNLLNVLRGFEDSVKDGSIDKAKITAFLKNWLVSHIMGIDTKYAAVIEDNKAHHAA